VTHTELVKHAERWLRNGFKVLPTYHKKPHKHRCGVVLANHCAATFEMPDAIGWFLCGGFSCLVECKVSRSDFLADKRKPFRVNSAIGMGMFRYYMTTPGIIKVEEVPERWGLVEVVGGRCYIALVAEQQPEYASRQEKALLYSALWRVQAKRETVELCGGAGI